MWRAPQPASQVPGTGQVAPPSCGNGSSAASYPGDQCDTDGMTRDIKETQGFLGHREGRGDLPELLLLSVSVGVFEIWGCALG